MTDSTIALIERLEATAADERLSGSDYTATLLDEAKVALKDLQEAHDALAVSAGNQFRALVKMETRAIAAEAELSTLREQLQEVRDKAVLGMSYGLSADAICDEIRDLIDARTALSTSNGGGDDA